MSIIESSLQILRWVLIALLLFTISTPFIYLCVGSSITALMNVFVHPQFNSALYLSVKTSICSLMIILITGTPLAWWLSRGDSKVRSMIGLLTMLPILVPPAVIGVGLLRAYGSRSWFGQVLDGLDIHIPFSSTAVIISQVIVSSPFYIQGASASFRTLNPSLFCVARSFGMRSITIFFKVTLPVLLPGVSIAVALTWARAIGEFGATLLFAGNMPDKTQTLPLAIFSALEINVQLAEAMSLLLVVFGGVILFGIRYLPTRKKHQRTE